MNDTGMFFATKAFPSVVRSVGIHGLFWYLVCLLCCVHYFCTWCYPKQKGVLLCK
jgi:hypothetical protein